MCEQALKDGNYDAAKSSYASSLNVMESMLDKLPPDKVQWNRMRSRSEKGKEKKERELSTQKIETQIFKKHQLVLGLALIPSCCLQSCLPPA